ncbi:hypothetical protein [Streptosporangium sp. NPDC001681]|uniref:hypothetical protein n=1 Tax=Streptosporangium sp. NPDC001681 TaxID=3154395 RepID=UPI00331C4B73
MDLREGLRRIAVRGGDFTEVRTELDRLLRRVIGYDIAAISTVDPATLLWTSCFVTGIGHEGGAVRAWWRGRLRARTAGTSMTNVPSRCTDRRDEGPVGQELSEATWVKSPF